MAGRKRRGRREWARLVTEYRSSGQSQREFAESRGVSVSSLARWCRSLEGTPEPVATSRGGFLEVVSRAVPPAMPERCVVLWVGECVSVELTGCPSPEYVARVARAYEALAR